MIASTQPLVVVVDEPQSGTARLALVRTRSPLAVAFRSPTASQAIIMP